MPGRKKAKLSSRKKQPKRPKAPKPEKLPGQSLLENLPVELIWMIAERLGTADHFILRLVSKSMRARTKGTDFGDKRDAISCWTSANEEFERRISYQPLSLICTMCQALHSPECFQDTERHQRTERRTWGWRWRYCISCNLNRLPHNFQVYKFNGEECFTCFGCSRPKLISEEAVYEKASIRRRWRCNITVDLLEETVMRVETFRRWCSGCLPETLDGVKASLLAGSQSNPV